MPATTLLHPPPELAGARRQAARHAIDYPVIAEHVRRGDIGLRVANVSPSGFMAADAVGLACGERLQMRLPVIGRIESHCVWARDARAGFQFERVIRPLEFDRMLAAMLATQAVAQARPRLIANSGRTIGRPLI